MRTKWEMEQKNFTGSDACVKRTQVPRLGGKIHDGSHPQSMPLLPQMCYEARLLKFPPCLGIFVPSYWRMPLRLINNLHPRNRPDKLIFQNSSSSAKMIFNRLLTLRRTRAISPPNSVVNFSNLISRYRSR